MRVVLFAATVTLVACADHAFPAPLAPPAAEPPPPPSTDALSGTWRAVFLNGAPLPGVISRGSPTGPPGTGMARLILVDSAMVILESDGRYSQAVYYTEWAASSSGEPERPLYSEIAVDAGRWERTLLGELMLESVWLTGRRIQGTAAEGNFTGLRLRHGITVGGAVATFDYRR